MKTANLFPLRFDWSACNLLGLIVATGMLLGSATQGAIAQTANADALFQNSQSGDNTSDPFSGRGNGQMNSLLDLIHQVTLGGGRSAADFQQEQQETINSEAADFRSRQLELLQQQNQPPSPTSAGQN